MTDNHKLEQFDDELLSAYVDGELGGEELALVEQRLADDPRARQLVDELRALSQELQTLPQLSVGEDLRSTIMQRAERAMLLGTAEQQTLAPRGSSSTRRWAWAAMVLAASLLLTLYLPTAQQEEKPLASAKPVPGASEDVRPAPERRLEAVSADEALEEEFAAQGGGVGGGGGGGFLDVDSVIEADSSKAFRSRAASAPAAVASASEPAEGKDLVAAVDDTRPELQVVLTFQSGANNFEQFNRLLLSNGIALEDADDQFANAQDGSNLIGKKNVAVVRSHGASRREATELEAEQSEVSEEVVLVEASVEQIENLLEACNADTENLAAVQLVTEQSSEQSAEQKTATLPLEKLRQWERSGKQLAQNKLRMLKRAKRSVSQSQRGRAMRLNEGQYQQQSNGIVNFEPRLLSQSSAPAKLNASPPVQVLFIIQQNSQLPASEPAAVGEAH